MVREAADAVPFLSQPPSVGSVALILSCLDLAQGFLAVGCNTCRAAPPWGPNKNQKLRSGMSARLVRGFHWMRRNFPGPGSPIEDGRMELAWAWERAAPLRPARRLVTARSGAPGGSTWRESGAGWAGRLSSSQWAASWGGRGGPGAGRRGRRSLELETDAARLREGPAPGAGAPSLVSGSEPASLPSARRPRWER